MISLRKESSWKFHTSAGGGTSFGPLLFSGGLFVLEDHNGDLHQFNYGGAGIGLSYPLSKLLRRPQLSLPRIMLNGHEIGATGATTHFPGDGVVYVTEACQGTDLTPRQFEGGAIYLDAGLGWLRGYGGTLLIAGMNPELLEMSVMIPYLVRFALSQATAIIFMKGQNEGLQQSAGVGCMFGEIRYQGPYFDGN